MLKRIGYIAFCMLLALSVSGCGQESALPTEIEIVPTEIVTVPTEETEAVDDSYLAAAQEYLDQGDFDAAIATLEQAKENSKGNLNSS